MAKEQLTREEQELISKLKNLDVDYPHIALSVRQSLKHPFILKLADSPADYMNLYYFDSVDKLMYEWKDPIKRPSHYNVLICNDFVNCM